MALNRIQDASFSRFSTEDRTPSLKCKEEVKSRARSVSSPCQKLSKNATPKPHKINGRMNNDSIRYQSWCIRSFPGKENAVRAELLIWTWDERGDMQRKLKTIVRKS